MKNFISTIYFRIVALIFIALIYLFLFKNKTDYNEYECETKGLELKGIIDYVNHKSGYMQVHITNREKVFSLNISKELYKKGFPEYYYYEVGDSIIKDASSKEFTIKRGQNIAIFLLDCGD